MSANINWAGVAFYTVIGVIIVLALLYFLWPTGPIHAMFSSLFSGLKLPAITLPKFDLNGVFKWISENSVVAGVMATLGTTAIGYFVKNYQTNKLLDQKMAELTEKEAALAAQTKEASKVATLQKQLDELNKDTTADTLQSRLSEITGENTRLQTQITLQKNQIDELMTRLANPEVKVVKVPI